MNDGDERGREVDGVERGETRSMDQVIEMDSELGIILEGLGVKKKKRMVCKIFTLDICPNTQSFVHLRFVT